MGRIAGSRESESRKRKRKLCRRPYLLTRLPRPKRPDPSTVSPPGVVPGVVGLLVGEGSEGSGQTTLVNESPLFYLAECVPRLLGFVSESRSGSIHLTFSPSLEHLRFFFLVLPYYTFPQPDFHTGYSRLAWPPIRCSFGRRTPRRTRGLLTLTRQKPPVDVQSIIDLAGIPVVQRVLIDGMRRTIGDVAGRRSITLNRRHRFSSEQERRWVLAEELGLVILDHRLVESTVPGKPTMGLLEERRIIYKREARAFAAELLMPFFEVRKRWFATSQERPAEGELSLEDPVSGWRMNLL